jgi:hypothetical protein
MSEVTQTSGKLEKDMLDETKAERTEQDVDVKSLIDQEVSKAIKNIKGNLDSAYQQRDEALAQVALAKEEKQKAEIAALEKAGKHQEIMQIKLNELTAKLESYEQKNTELSRDNAVRTQLSALNFKSDKAAKMAYTDIVSSLKRDATGNWVHENGASIEETVSSYAKDDNNAFLFSVKANVGTGTTPAKPTTGNNPVKSIKEMSSQEMIDAVAKGQINPGGEWSE